MFQNVPQFRRKEIMNGLSTNMKELCDWFIALLREHSTKALALVSLTLTAQFSSTKHLPQTILSNLS